MKYNVKFAPEKRNDKTGQPIVKNVPIFAQITFAGNRVFYFTGYRVDIEKFNPEKQEVGKNSFGMEGLKKVQYNIINQRFKAIGAALELFFQNTETASKSDVISLLDKTCKKAKHEPPAIVEPEKITDVIPITDFYGMFRKYQNEAKISEGTRKHVKSVINHLERYEVNRKIKLSFEIINSDLLKDFEKYLQNESTRPKGKDRAEQVFSPKGQNTIHALMKLFKTVYKKSIKDLSAQGIKIDDPFADNGYQVPGEVYGKPIYITSSERDKLFNLALTSERLKHVRDIFVFQCLIGARVGDLSKLTKANIQKGILTYIPRKTAKKEPSPISVPLNKKALEILSRYDLPGGQLLPFISDQKYNDYLKDLFKEAELNRTVTRQNPTTGKNEIVKICDIVTSHWARRAFVGNLYGKVDSGIIASMSGHVADSRAFSRYYKVDEKLQKKAINLL